MKTNTTEENAQTEQFIVSFAFKLIQGQLHLFKHSPVFSMDCYISAAHYKIRHFKCHKFKQTKITGQSKCETQSVQFRGDQSYL